MNLDVFSYMDQIMELYESKKDIYKLIADEVKDYFETEIFDQSKYTLSMTYRVKSPDSIREKLIRNNYMGKYQNIQDILPNIQDIIGMRIECKFIDDEKYVYELLKELFSKTDDGVYFYTENMPRIKLKLSDPQPQKQKNGFDIYKIDGLYQLGKETVRIELQIKALVNLFWGEIEHKIIYKNNSYLMVDDYVHDLMISIKKSLNMIDSQLHVLYKRFKRAEDETSANQEDAIKKLLSKMIYDTYAEKLKKQIGFTINFKMSCDAIVDYITRVNNAEDLEDYGRAMINMFFLLNAIKEDEEVSVDTRIEFERDLVYEDTFSKNIAGTVQDLINIDFNWHMFFLILFNIERGNNTDDLESFILYYKNQILSAQAFERLEFLGENTLHMVKLDVLNRVSEIVGQVQKVELLCPAGILKIHHAIELLSEAMLADSKEEQTNWEISKNDYLVTIDRELNEG